MIPINPYDHQTLFAFAIRQQWHVIGEFGIRRNAWELWKWARRYAKEHQLECPTRPEEFGIYYPPDDEEEAELRGAGLLPEGWEAIRDDEGMWF